MRDCVFFTADCTMKQALLGFLTRKDCFSHYNLGTAPFLFHPNEDLISLRNDGSRHIHNR